MLQTVLYSIFTLLILIGGLQFVLIPRDKANRQLGIALIIIGVGIFQATYLMYPQSCRINILLLLPLNIVFAPYFFALGYLNSLSQKKLFPHIFQKTVQYIAVLEIALHLLPLGVILFMGEYSRAILDFLFNIRRIIYIIFTCFTFYGLYKGLSNLKRIHIYEEIDRKIYSSISSFILIIALVAFLACLSVTIPYILKDINRIIFYIPQIVIGLFGVCWGIYNIILNQKISQATIDEYKEIRNNSNPIYKRMITLIEEEKIYRNPNLRISEVADRLSITPNYLSRIINEVSDEGFNELINHYRVDEVIELIQNGNYKNQTIFSLAQQAGFSSKSTFQSVFKKITGRTPSEYKTES